MADFVSYFEALERRGLDDPDPTVPRQFEEALDAANRTWWDADDAVYAKLDAFARSQ